VTEALGELADAGMIRQGRGRIDILDRPRMLAESCECYDTVRANLEQLIGRDPSRDGATAAAAVKGRSGSTR
jgi:hypothetical protein